MGRGSGGGGTIEIAKAPVFWRALGAVLLEHAVADRALPERRRLGLYEFVREAWPWIEPGVTYQDNWHIRAICDHLEAIVAGVVGDWRSPAYAGLEFAQAEERFRRLRQLLINMPPRCMKSLTVSVCLVPWAWGEVSPTLKFLYASYALPLSVRDSVKARRLIQSPWYQRQYGHRYQLAPDNNLKQRFDNDRGGYRIATSVGGALTGEGGDVLISDDPHNVVEVESEARRAEVLDWYDQSMSTRLNDPKRGARVVVMQRIHWRDLTGHLREQGGWELLKLPMEYEPGPAGQGGTALGFADPRAEPGELLWPERFGQGEVDELKVKLGPYGAAGQLQQRPAPLAGGIIKRDWWQYFPPTKRLRLRKLAIFVDTAQKGHQAADFSVFLLAGVDVLRDYYVLDLYRARLEYPDLVETTYDFWLKHSRRFGKVLALVIEDKGSGSSLVQTLRRGEVVNVGGKLIVKHPRLPALPYKLPFGQDKAARAQAVTPLIAAGRVFLPEGAEWLPEFLLETGDFPNAPNDDQVDVLSMALRWLAGEDQVVRVAE